MKTKNLTLVPIAPSIRTAEFIARQLTLCPLDAEEMAALGYTSYKALFECCTRARDLYIGLLDGDICGVCGVAENPFVDIPFMLSDGRAREKYPKQFLKISRMFDKECMGKSRYLENYCSEHNQPSITWLKWLGFKFDDIECHISNGVKFYRFWREKNVSMG